MPGVEGAQPLLAAVSALVFQVFMAPAAWSTEFPLFVTSLGKLLNQSLGVEENNELIRGRGAIALFQTWLLS